MATRYEEARDVTEGSALVWILECEMATLEELKAKKKSLRRDLNRHERIVSFGLQVCRKFNLVGAAHAAGCRRVASRLMMEATKKELTALCPDPDLELLELHLVPKG